MPLTRNQQAVLQSGNAGQLVSDEDGTHADLSSTSDQSRSPSGQIGRFGAKREGPSRTREGPNSSLRQFPTTPEKQRYSLRRGRTGTTQSPGRANVARLQQTANDVSKVDAFGPGDEDFSHGDGEGPSAQTGMLTEQSSLEATPQDHFQHLSQDQFDHQRQHHTESQESQLAAQGESQILQQQQQEQFAVSGIPQSQHLHAQWSNQPRNPDFNDDVLMQNLQSYHGQNTSHEAFLLPPGQALQDVGTFAMGPLAMPGDGPMDPQHDINRLPLDHAMAVQRPQPLSEEAFAALQAQMAGNMTPERQGQHQAAHFAHHGTPQGNRQMLMHTTPVTNRGMGQSGHGLSVPATVPRASSALQHDAGPSNGAEHHARTFSTDGLDAFLAAQQGRANPRMGDGTEGGGAAFLLPNHVARMQLHHGAPVTAHRAMLSGDASMSMDFEQGHPAFSTMNGSPIARAMADGRSALREDMRSMMRQNPSLGQMGTVMNVGPHEGVLRMNGGQMRPVDLASLEQMRALHHHQQQQAGHFGGMGFHAGRAFSPGEGMPAPGTIMGNVSPHSSIATGRYAGDSSIDTSTDSFSNSATTMSAVPSQASSISDDLLSLSSGGRRAPKGKTRLRNIDRKAICEAARNDPKVRQEDLAARFGIERSTVSKTLKNKDKWLAIDDDSDGALIVKHRTGKFPEVEERLHAWLQHEHAGIALSDTILRGRSLEIAREIGFGQDQFKASLGWIEKFRERYRIPKPINQETDMHDVRRGAQPFNSMVSLSAHHPSEDRYVAEIDSAGLGRGDAQLHRHEQDVDVAMFASPLPQGTLSDGMQMVPNASTPQRPRSASHEATGMIMHETPKASKRHYDDMSLASRELGSQDASMAQGQLSGSGTATTEHSPTESHSGAHSAGEGVNMASGITDGGPPLSASKRRRGAHSAQGHVSRDDRAASMGLVAGDFTTTGDHPLSLVENAQSQGMGPPSGGRRSLRNRTIEISTQGSRPGNESSSASPLTQNTEMLQLPTSHLPDRSSTPRGSSSSHSHVSPTDAPSPLRQGSLSGLISSQLSSAEGISHSGLASTMSLLAGAKTSGSGDQASAQREVSIDEARDSLDVLLSFVARQPAGISPSDYFVLGNLQGMLSQLANQSRQGTPQATSSGTAPTSASATPAMQGSSTSTSTYAHDEAEMHESTLERGTGA